MNVRSLDLRRCAPAAAPADRQPRVCFLTDTYYPIIGGGETYVRNIATRLAAFGTQVCVVTRRVHKRFPAFERMDGVPVYRLRPAGLTPAGKYLMLPFAAWRLIALRRRFDVLYVSNYRALGPMAVLLAKLLGKKCVLRAGVCGEFSGEYIIADGGLPRVALAWLRAVLALRRAILTRADRFVSNCRAITEEFERGGAARERVILLPGGVDTARFTPASAGERVALRVQLRLPAAGFLIGYAGKLNRGKGVDHLIRALPSLLRSHPDLSLVLIGSGKDQSLSQESELRALVERLGLEERVHFTGYVDSVPDYLRSLDLFVLPTEREALPNALMEAMACGLPSIASRVGGVPDIIDHEVSGLLVEPGAPEPLAQAITRLRAEPALAQRLADAGRRRIEQSFSLDVLARRHQEFLADLAAGATAAPPLRSCAAGAVPAPAAEKRLGDVR